MKILNYILLTAGLILFAGCDSNDDGFYNRVYVDADNLVAILPTTDPQYNFKLQSFIPRLLPEEGETELLDIRQTTGNANSFDFSFVIEKLSDGNWIPVDMSGDIENVTGDVLAGSFVVAEAQYDLTEDAYVFRCDVDIDEPGTYRLSYGYNSSELDVVELISNSSNNNIFVNIYSSTSDVDEFGFYNFTVN